MIVFILAGILMFAIGIYMLIGGYFLQKKLNRPEKGPHGPG